MEHSIRNLIQKRSVFDELNNDTVGAVKALQDLGGVDAQALDNFEPEPQGTDDSNHYGDGNRNVFDDLYDME